MPDRTARQHSREIFSSPNTTLLIAQANTSDVDAFGKKRISGPTTRFDNSFEYDLQPLFWDTSLSGGADITHDSTKHAAIMTVSGSTAGTGILQTFAYHPYQKGKSQRPVMTFALGARANGITRRIGYFDDDDGVFLEQTNEGLFMVLRSSTGEPLIRTSQADWSQNSFAGGGDKVNSEFNVIDLDETKRQIWDSDIEWLGVGRVRFGWNIDGMTIYAHYINNANMGIAAPYMRTGTLPLRYEIVNDGTGVASELVAMCSVVFSEGGVERERGVPFTANRGVVSASVANRRPVITIRPKATFNSLTNRGEITPINIEIFTATEAVLVEVVHNGIIFATGGYASVDPNSITEFDISATVISGGHVVQSFPVSTAGVGANERGGGGSPILSRLPLTLDIDGNNPLPLSIVCTPLSGTASVLPSINWDEVR
jgi:hypothetical protein